MHTFKYVFNKDTGKFLLIPDIMAHSEVTGIWTNAGFVSIIVSDKDKYGDNIYKAICYGESISLKLKCDPEKEDSQVISKYLNLEG